MKYIVFDSGHNHKDYYILENEFRSQNLNIHIFNNTGGWGTKIWLQDAIKLVKQSKKNDTLIYWADIQGIFAFWYCKIFRYKRNIIILNILLKRKKTIKNYLVSYLYKYALNSNLVKYTVTSLEYGIDLQKRLRLKPYNTVLHDLFIFDQICEQSSFKRSMLKMNSTYIFCGGRNGRDWNVVAECANRLKSFTFCIVLSKNDKNKYNHLFSKLQNVCVFENISLNEFNALLYNCKLSFLPLNTEAPAGLTVLFQSILYNKLILTTNTLSTREYLNGFENFTANHSIDCYINRINFLMQERSFFYTELETLKNELKTKCSLAQYVDGIKACISDF